MTERTGEGEIAKTPEELKADKIAAFNENPDSFLDKRTIVACAALKADGSVGIIINPVKRSQLYMAKAKLDHYIEQGLTVLDVNEARANAPRIHKPGIRNRIKGAFGKGG